MAFNPDKWLADEGVSDVTFNPDKWLADEGINATKIEGGQFWDPTKTFLREPQIPVRTPFDPNQVIHKPEEDIVPSGLPETPPPITAYTPKEEAYYLPKPIPAAIPDIGTGMRGIRASAAPSPLSAEEEVRKSMEPVTTAAGGILQQVGKKMQRTAEKTPDDIAAINRGRVLAETIPGFDESKLKHSDAKTLRDARSMGLNPEDLGDLSRYLFDVTQRKKAAIGAKETEIGKDLVQSGLKINPAWLREAKITEKIDQVERAAPTLGTALRRGDVAGSADFMMASAAASGDEDFIGRAMQAKKRIGEISATAEKPKNAFVKAVYDAAEMAPLMAKSAALSTVPVVGPVLSTSMWAAQGMGDMYYMMRERGVPHDIALEASMGTSVLYAMIENAQVKQITNSGALRPITESFTRRLTKLGAERGWDFVKENLEEVGQGFVEGGAVGNALVLAGASRDEANRVAMEIANPGETLKQTLGPMAILNIPATIFGVGKLARRQAGSQAAPTPSGAQGTETLPRKEAPNVQQTQGRMQGQVTPAPSPTIAARTPSAVQAPSIGTQPPVEAAPPAAPSAAPSLPISASLEKEPTIQGQYAELADYGIKAPEEFWKLPEIKKNELWATLNPEAQDAILSYVSPIESSSPEMVQATQPSSPAIQPGLPAKPGAGGGAATREPIAEPEPVAGAAPSQPQQLAVSAPKAPAVPKPAIEMSVDEYQALPEPQRIEAFRELQKTATLNPVTKVPGQEAYNIDFAHHTKKQTVPVTVAMGDLNGLKEYNDVLTGMTEADKYLATVQQYVAAEVPSASVYHLHGDEFAVIAPQMAPEGLQVALQRAMKKMAAEKIIQKDDVEYHPSMSWMVGQAATQAEIGERLNPKKIGKDEIAIDKTGQKPYIIKGAGLPPDQIIKRGIHEERVRQRNLAIGAPAVAGAGQGNLERQAAGPDIAQRQGTVAGQQGTAAGAATAIQPTDTGRPGAGAPGPGVGDGVRGGKVAKVNVGRKPPTRKSFTEAYPLQPNTEYTQEYLRVRRFTEFSLSVYDAFKNGYRDRLGNLKAGRWPGWLADYLVLADRPGKSGRVKQHRVTENALSYLQNIIDGINENADERVALDELGINLPSYPDDLRTWLEQSLPSAEAPYQPNLWKRYHADRGRTTIQRDRETEDLDAVGERLNDTTWQLLRKIEQLRSDPNTVSEDDRAILADHAAELRDHSEKDSRYILNDDEKVLIDRFPPTAARMPESPPPTPSPAAPAERAAPSLPAKQKAYFDNLLSTGFVNLTKLRRGKRDFIRLYNNVGEERLIPYDQAMYDYVRAAASRIPINEAGTETGIPKTETMREQADRLLEKGYKYFKQLTKKVGDKKIRVWRLYNNPGDPVLFFPASDKELIDYIWDRTHPKKMETEKTSEPPYIPEGVEPPKPKKQESYTDRLLNSVDAFNKKFEPPKGETEARESEAETRPNETIGEEPAFQRPEEGRGQIYTPEFKRWFGDWENDPENASKVVDKNGKPLVVYHGSETNEPIVSFEQEKQGARGHPAFGAFYFAEKKSGAESYGKNLGEYFLNVKNPFDPYKYEDHVPLYEEMAIKYYKRNTDSEDSPETIMNGLDDYSMPSPYDQFWLNEMAKEYGFDGVVYNEASSGSMVVDRAIAVFSPTQIKSATGNRGTFDPDNHDIRFQRPSRLPAAEQFDLFAAPKALEELEAEERSRAQRAEIKRRQEERKGGEANIAGLPLFENVDIEGSQQTLFQRGDQFVEANKMVGKPYSLTELKSVVTGAMDEVMARMPSGLKGRVQVRIASSFEIRGRRFGDKEAWEMAVWYNPEGKVVEIYINPDIPSDRVALGLAHELPGHIGSRLVYADNPAILEKMRKFFEEQRAADDPFLRDIEKRYRADMARRPEMADDILFDEWTAHHLARYINDGARDSIAVRVYNYLRHMLVKLGLAREQVDDVLRNMVREMRRVPTELLEGGGGRFQKKELADPFFSPLLKAVQALRQERGTGEQMFNMITKAPGVKEAEWKWMELDDFLKGKQSVTKGEIEGFVRGNAVRVEEVEKGVPYDVSENIAPSEINRLARDFAADRGDDWRELGPNARQEYENDAIRHIEKVRGGSTKFSQYTLPGGNNYREVLLTLPTNRKQTFEDFKTQYKKRYPNVDASEDQLKKYYESGVKVPVTGSSISGFDKNIYKSSHWEEPNVVAHIRMNDRTGPDGEKVLFIEEIQSDWARDVRENGITISPNKERLDYLTEKIDSAQIGYSWGNESPIQQAVKHGKITQQELDEHSRLLETDRHKSHGVPNQPFLKNWEELTLKRILRLAAEEGYDRVAWINGKQTAERYDLSKRISNVQYYPGEKRLIAFDRVSGDSVLNETGVEEKDIEKYIGKEPARRLLEAETTRLANPFGNDNRGKVIEGEGLRVGGEWANNLYNEKIPNILKKYGKKWGVSVENINLAKNKNIQDAYETKVRENYTGDEYPYVVMKNGVEEAFAKSEEDAERIIGRLRGKIIYNNEIRIQQSIAITPEMQESVLFEGQPMFQRSRLSEPAPEVVPPPPTLEEIYAGAAAKKESIIKKITGGEKSFKQTADRIAADWLVPLSTRLKKIGPQFKEQMRRFEFASHQAEHKDTKAVQPFLKAMKKMSGPDRRVIDLALKNGDSDKVKEIVWKYNLGNEYAAVRAALNGIRQRALKSGLDVNYVREYWPRVVLDPQGLLGEVRESEKWGLIEDEIQKIEEDRGRILTEKEKADVANRFIARPDRMIDAPGALKQRNLAVITEKIDRYYDYSPSALLTYLHEMNQTIEMRKFFGLDAMAQEAKEDGILSLFESDGKGNSFGTKITDIDGGIGRYVMEARDRDQLTDEQLDELVGLLKARFGFRPTTGIIKTIKDLGYIGAMGSGFSSFITQLGDLAWAYYVAGPIKATKAFATAMVDKSAIKKEDLGLDRIAEEFRTVRGLGKILNKIFDITLLTKMDNVGKETLINGYRDSLKKKAARNDTALMEELRRVFGDEADAVRDELAAGKTTDNVKYLLFSRLLDFQPMALSEMPKTYLDSPCGRILYMLKTFTLKQLDVFKNEGISKITEGLKAGNKAQVIKGLRDLMYIVALFVAANAGADEIKDWLFDRRPSFDDKVWDNILRLFGLSRYIAWEARRQGAAWAAARLVMPPTDILESPIRDIEKILGDKDTKTSAKIRNAETWKTIPFFGKHYYWWFGGGRLSGEKHRITDYNETMRNYERKIEQLRKDKKSEQLRAVIKDMMKYRKENFREIEKIKRDLEKIKKGETDDTIE